MKNSDWIFRLFGSSCDSICCHEPYIQCDLFSLLDTGIESNDSCQLLRILADCVFPHGCRVHEKSQCSSNTFMHSPTISVEIFSSSSVYFLLPFFWPSIRSRSVHESCLISSRYKSARCFVMMIIMSTFPCDSMCTRGRIHVLAKLHG